jgi:hypothetical protein
MPLLHTLVNLDHMYFAWCDNYKTNISNTIRGKTDDGYWLDETSCSTGVKDLYQVMYVLHHYTFQSHTKCFEHTVHEYMYVPVRSSTAVPSASKHVCCFLAKWKYYNTWKFEDAIHELYKYTISSFFCMCVC